MKKLIGLSLLIVASLFGVTSANAQDHNRHDNERHRGQWERRYEQPRYHTNYGMHTKTEYRYVKYGYRVYRETYQVTYNNYGQAVYRQLINREEVRDYDRHRSGFRFNVYLPIR